MSVFTPLYRTHQMHGAAWSLVTPPAIEPVTVAEARNFLSLTQINDDSLIESQIRAAREEAEDCMSRGLYTQTWQLSLHRFFDVMSLPRAFPLQNDALASPSTAPVITYYDTDDVLQTLNSTGYAVDTSSRPGRIIRGSGQSWPGLSADRQGARVFIAYVLGYTDVALIPARITQGIKMRLASFYSDREGFEPGNDRARQAAEACWTDVVYWPEPSDSHHPYAHWPWA